ncbi:MAG: T9SS type A sorting domain-containing protein [candidate division WOR-3 bacterium]|nr:T9SS type A sorting domain-containing protein [candidate division WOR-3 bacterium]
MRRLVVGLTLLVAASFGYTLFTENFDAAWSTNNPPTGWRIFHTAPGDSGRDDWHREPANTAPWAAHPTPFAAIALSTTPDAPPDSLISPTIDCSGYKNVTLVCSTYFYRWSSQPYIARLVYSTDGGATWPYTLHDYYLSSSSDPVLESLHLDQAGGQANVQLAWVYDGDINYIQWWSVDDISVVGESVPAWDVCCQTIYAPAARVSPGPMQPYARFSNQGDSLQVNVPVACSLYDNAMVGLAAWADTIDTLKPKTGQKFVLFAPPYNLPFGKYFIKFWCAADSDHVRSNDTLSRSFEASPLKELRYDDGNAGSATYKSWPVGHYGWGVKLDAGTFPVYIESLKVRLQAPANPNYRGYQLAVFLDDGAGHPGKLYFKTPVQYAAAGTSAMNSVFLGGNGDQLVMPDGQFYVFYLQVGEPPECPALGCDAARSPLASYWQYRNGVMLPDSTPGDFMIRAVVNLAPVTPALVDLRALYVDQPLYDFVQRPFDAPITPKGRIDNFGSQAVAPASVLCDIIGPGPVVYYSDTVTLASLAPGQDTLVTFRDWVPGTAERCLVVLRTLAGGDMVPQNDEKRFAVDVLKGAHTGSSPLQYGWTDSDTTGGPTFAWIGTAGFNRIGGLGDNGFISVPFEPGMHFPFYDSTYEYVLLSANGWVSFGASSPGGDVDTVPDKLPTPSAPNRCVYAWWDNLAQSPLGNGQVYYRWFGSEPNRYMVLVFENVNRKGTDTANGITFELIFRENGTILCQYKDVETGDLNFDNGKNASIGLENKDGTDGLNYLYARPPMSTAVNDPANRLSPGRAIMFFQEKRDAAAVAIVRPESYEFPGVITPQAKIQNYGTISDSIRVFMTFTGPSIYAHDTLVTGLAAGDSTIVSFAPWNAVVGTYAAACSVHMVGDVNASNNRVSKTVYVTAWARRADIPPQWRKRKVKSAALCYAPTTHKLYALKGSNTTDFWEYDIAADSWDTLKPIPLAPSGRKPRDGTHLTFDPDNGALGRVWAIKAGGRADFYYYDIASDSWTACSSAVVTYRDYPYSDRTYRAPRRGAAIEYVPQGPQGSVYAIPGNRTNYFWVYDIATNSWSYPHDSVSTETQGGSPYWSWIPLDVPTGRYGVRCKDGADLAYLNGKLYLLKGSASYEAYGFSPTLNAWTDTLDVNSFVGPHMRKVKVGGSLVANGDRLYALKGGNTQEFWHYDFFQKIWSQSTDIPLAMSGRRVKIKRGSAMASVDSTIFVLKGSNSYEFWEYKAGADSLLVLGDQPEREGVMADQGALDLSRPWLVAYPNPTSVGLTISYNITGTAPTHLRIYDAAGKLVASLWNATREHGQYVAHWNALTAGGGRIAAGVYFVKLESGESRLTQKFIVQH